MPAEEMSRCGILMFDRKLARDDIEDVALRTPMVGEIAGLILDDAQLDTARLAASHSGARAFAQHHNGRRPRPVGDLLVHVCEVEDHRLSPIAGTRASLRP